MEYQGPLLSSSLQTVYIYIYILSSKDKKKISYHKSSLFPSRWSSRSGFVKCTLQLGNRNNGRRTNKMKMC